jgi:sugar fermentation stimulation protein A
MQFTKSLIKGKLIKRYKRFFTDIKIGKEIVTAHCPNTGSMMGLLDEGNEVFISKNDNSKRKLKYTLEIIKTNNLIKEIKNTDNIKPEVFFDKETRFDFLIQKNKQKIFVEVKNVTLFRDKKIAEFPDSITSRGTKHLKTLIEAKKKGYKSYLLFLVQIQGVENFKIAKDIDKEYYENYLLAKKAGVIFLAYRCKINLKEIKIEKKIKIINA